jgi:hypothetical protein
MIQKHRYWTEQFKLQRNQYEKNKMEWSYNFRLAYRKQNFAETEAGHIL